MHKSTLRQAASGWRQSLHLPGVLLVSVLISTSQPLSAQTDSERDRINSQPDNIGTGAYPALKEELGSLPEHVLYRPADIGQLGTQKLGVVAWANGGCSVDGASSRFHLLELASHGYLVIASGNILSGPGAPLRDDVSQADRDPVSQPRTEASALIHAVDWALQENQRPESPYYQRIDPTQVALSGFSCGGLQALEVAADPRVQTLVLHNTGILNEGPSTAIPGMHLEKTALNDIHTSVIYIMGGEEDIAYMNGLDDFERINHVPVAFATLPVGHGGTFLSPNGGSAAQVAVNWLQWQLRGESRAADYFLGEDCGLCRNSDWQLMSKDLDRDHD